MGKYGYYVIDSDGHGGEPPQWRHGISAEWRPQMVEYVAKMKEIYGDLPGAGSPVHTEDDQNYGEYAAGELDFETPLQREGMAVPGPRMTDMDLEGIDVTVMFPPGSGEEWALGDPGFADELCRLLNDARATYASYDPARLKLVAKLPLIDPERAAAELDRCFTQYPDVFVGMVTAQHVLDRNLNHPALDAVWEVADSHSAAVCVHGGGQAPDQVPIVLDRYDTRLEKHAVTHPFGAMLATMNFTVGGILHRFPNMRVGIMEAGCGWLPFWLERLDEEYELMPDQAPVLDRKPSEYFLSGRCFVGVESTESALPYVMDQVGEDILCYSSDYCHWDCDFPHSVKLLVERDDLSDERKRKILTDNPASLFGIPVPA